MGEQRWFVWARWVWVALLSAAALGARARGYLSDIWPMLAVCGVTVAYNLALPLVVRRLPARAGTLCLLALLADALGLTLFLHHSGDIENPLRAGFLYPVVAAAVLLSRRAAVRMAAVSALLLSVLVSMTSFGWPIRLAHNHLHLVGEFSMEGAVDPAVDPRGRDYVAIRVLWVYVELFAAAYGFGLLGERLRDRERALEVEGEQIRGLLHALPVGVVVFETNGSIVLQNPIVRSLFGDLVGRSVGAVDPRFGIADRFASSTVHPLFFETGLDGRNLEHVLARVSERGRVVWVLRDRTEAVRLQARVVHQGKMADLGLLAAGVAHEIGNPLSSLSAILQLLRAKEVQPELADRLRAIASHAQRIQRVLEDVTSFARPSDGKEVRVPVGTLVDGALAIFRFHEKSKGAQLTVSGCPGPVVGVIEDQLTQVFLNLLLNAADATRDHGAIAVAVGEAAGEAVVAVQDTGVGMTSEVLRNLFVPFHTTKPQGKGTGLGLFVSDTIVSAHGGRIEVRSEPERGSTFTVFLPVARS